MLYFLLLLAISLGILFSKAFPLFGRKASAPAKVEPHGPKSVKHVSPGETLRSTPSNAKATEGYPHIDAQTDRRGSLRRRVSWSADLQAKLAYQRVNLISPLALVLLGTTFHLLPRIISILTILAELLVFAVPLRFELSDEGIAANGRMLRSWGELNSYRIKERRVTLRGKGRLNFLNLYLPRDQETRGLALKFIRQKVSEELPENRVAPAKR